MAHNGPPQKSRGDLILKEILGDSKDQMLPYSLLQEIFAGYPVASVSTLVRSGRPAAVRAGGWILSELGSEGSQLLPEVVVLLRDSDPEARVYGLEAATAMADVCPASTLAQAFLLIGDDNVAVARHAIRLLAVIDKADLLRGSTKIEDAHLRDLTTALVKLSDSEAGIEPTIRNLVTDDPFTRRVAAAAAFRLAGLSDQALQRAADSGDVSVSRFASIELQVLGLHE